MEKQYAQALIRSLRKGTNEEKLVSGLVAHLKEEGRAKLLPGILRELKTLQARNAKLAPHIEIASEGDKKQALQEAKELGIDTNSVSVNEDLIQGWRARSGGISVDRSAKQALVDLYQKITN
ncbi:F0F1 ATP synthase subunit delta [Patescibacteria group bacterium]|nr:F0F1 ATP synthase subunit delta [Patescibacteria group bacterium]MBU2159047.1 F0F1 ATP synthase subunit delta [Patescibacteria group bacterium]MBU2220696.1 F0F1 ATP synthase subunit delta [Patescibacteria group bacterium]